MAQRVPIVIGNKNSPDHAMLLAAALAAAIAHRPALAQLYTGTVQVLLVDLPSAPARGRNCVRSTTFLPLLGATREQTRRLNDAVASLQKFVSATTIHGVYAVAQDVHARLERERAYQVVARGTTLLRDRDVSARLGNLMRPEHVYHAGAFVEVPIERLAWEVEKSVRKQRGRIRVFSMKDGARLVPSPDGFSIIFGHSTYFLGPAIVAAGEDSLPLMKGLDDPTTVVDFISTRRELETEGATSESMIYTVAADVEKRVIIRAESDCPAQPMRHIEECTRPHAGPAVAPPAAGSDTASQRMRRKAIRGGKQLEKVFRADKAPVIFANHSDLASQAIARERVITQISDLDWVLACSNPSRHSREMETIDGLQEIDTTNLLNRQCVGCPKYGQ